MLDDRVRAGEHQARVTVVETHQVGRLPARSADLDDLARPIRMAHDVAMHVEPVPDGCLHAPTSSSAFACGMSAFRRCRAPGTRSTVYPDCHGQRPPGAGGWYRLCMVFPRSCAVPPLPQPGEWSATRLRIGNGAPRRESGAEPGAEQPAAKSHIHTGQMLTTAMLPGGRTQIIRFCGRPRRARRSTHPA